jgi:hypothetical protein
MALSEGLGVFRRVYNNPDAFVSQTRYEAWVDRYTLNWSYYIGSALDNLGIWSAYRAQHRLYKFTRNVYNPTRRLVDFYAGTIYPGLLTADARRFEDGTVIAIPFAEDTPRTLTTAIASLWKWSNWHIHKTTMIRFAATAGECLVEIIDDLEARKIYFQVWYPSMVRNVRLDVRGNVKSYTIEYTYEEEVDDPDGIKTGRRYRYKKIVTDTTVRTFRDDQPYAYDENGSVYSHPYGFAPAVWVKHTEVGLPHGEPCMRYMSKWDELNALASHWLDQAHRVLEAPLLVSGDGIQQLDLDAPTLPSEPRRPDMQRAAINILRGSLGSDIKAVQPPSGDVMLAVDHLIEEIEKDHPELTMHREMRKMSQVTGPAVTRLFGDVEIMVNEARTNYDTQMVKAHQMGVAIGGYRANNGDWGDDLTEDRRVFLPFGLESYERRELDFEIADRPLVPLGRYETIQTQRSEVALAREELMLKQQRAMPLGAEGNPGLPSGDQAVQISNRLRMRSSTEGVGSNNGPANP